MALSDAELLRLYLDDQLPEGGSDTDAKFSDEEINDFLERAGDVRAAAVLGWQARAAELAKYIDQSEGPSKVYLQQRHENALNMVGMFGGNAAALAPTSKTKIRKIVR